MENRLTISQREQEEFQEKINKHAERFSELLESIGTTENGTGRDSAGDRNIEGWEQLVKSTASKGIGRKLIVCIKAVTWWGEK